MDNQRTDTKLAIRRLLFGVVLLIILGFLVWLVFFRHSGTNSQTSLKSPASSQSSKGTSSQTQPTSAGANSQKTAAQTPASDSSSTNSATPQTQSQLADTGPGNIAAIALLSTVIIGTFSHAFLSRRLRMRRE